MTAIADSRRSRRSQNAGSAQQAMFSAGRGLGLILVAIVIGIVLLYVVDDGSSGPADDAAPTTTAAADTGGGTQTTASGGTQTTVAATARPPAEVKIKVYNAGRPTGTAGKMTDQLRTRGYTNALGPGDIAPRTGTVVACRPGFDGADAAALATAVGSSAKVEPFPTPEPPQVGDANCVVILGT